jgi:hypothetical protein
MHGFARIGMPFCRRKVPCGQLRSQADAPDHYDPSSVLVGSHALHLSHLHLVDRAWLLFCKPPGTSLKQADGVYQWRIYRAKVSVCSDHGENNPACNTVSRCWP